MRLNSCKYTDGSAAVPRLLSYFLLSNQAKTDQLWVWIAGVFSVKLYIKAHNLRKMNYNEVSFLAPGVLMRIPVYRNIFNSVDLHTKNIKYIDKLHKMQTS